MPATVLVYTQHHNQVSLGKSLRTVYILGVKKVITMIKQ
jgi:hypothetical protein